MRKLINKISLKTKIIGITIITIILLMFVFLFAGHKIGFKLSKQKFEEELAVIVDIIGNRSLAALIFDDTIAGDRNLSSARFHPNIQKLCLYNKSGILLSSYLAQTKLESCDQSINVNTEDVALKTIENTIKFSRLIKSENNTMGFLVVHANLDYIQSTSSRLLNALLLFISILIPVTSILMFFVIKKTLKPLTDLRNTANLIAGNPFSKVRAKHYNNDEVGDLVNVFNNMLDRLNEEKEALRISDEALRRSQKLDAVGRLSGGIAHDFNNILSIILGNTEILRRVQHEDPHGCINNIDKATQRAIELTSKLLKFTKNKTSLSKTVDVDKVINEMKGLLKHSLTPLININYSLSEESKLIEVDQGDFEDTIINLVINARDAMKTGGQLTIETETITLSKNYTSSHSEISPNQYIVVSVADTGEGMTQDTQANIFEPFFSTKPKSNLNIGMGMSMVFGFIQRSNAHIHVESTIDIGTKISLFFLPSKQQESISTVSDIDISELGKLSKNKTVLLVDDELDIIQVAQNTLQQQGFKTYLALNYEEALEILSKNHIDIIFSDIVMEGEKNGLDLAEEVNENYPSIKILLTSGYASISQLKRSKYLNKNKIMRKPYKQKEMLRQILTVLKEQI